MKYYGGYKRENHGDSKIYAENQVLGFTHLVALVDIKSNF